ncbi:MAG TPA: tetratricopeptide repeat protein, partial [Verrucomicrobiae bacterium]|nr:tetratricopeptide repeat protein [Verrucomicrobiae bacterium]
LTRLVPRTETLGRFFRRPFGRGTVLAPLTVAFETVHLQHEMNQPRPFTRTNPAILAGLLVFVFLSGFFQVSDCDVGYHLRTAAHILHGNGIPTTNTFSSATPDHPWLLHQWLGTLIFYAAYSVSGVTSLIVFKAMVAVGIMFLVWLRARDLAPENPFVAFWVVTLGTIAARVRFFERPDFLSAFFFAMLLWLDQKWGRQRRWQWIGLPLLMAVWANTHAGVIYGFVLLSVLAGAESLEVIHAQIRNRSETGHSGAWGRNIQQLALRPVGFIIAAALACLTVQVINPNGWRVLWFPISQFSSRFWQSIIVEYQPPGWAGDKAFYLFLAAVILLQVITLRGFNFRLFLVSAAFGYLACSSQRSLLFFTIAAVPHAAFMLAQLLPPRPLRVAPGDEGPTGSLIRRAGALVCSASWNSCALVAAWSAAVAFLFVPNQTFRFGSGWYHPYYPLAIYQTISREVPPQGIFNEMRYGGSMLWWLYPRFKPFIDGRGDAYSEEFWLTEYFPILDARPGWKDLLQKYQLHCALLPMPETGKALPLVDVLGSDPQWAVVAFDDNAVLFLERTATNSLFIAQHEFKVLRPGDWSFAWIESPQMQQPGAIEIDRLLADSPESRFGRTARARLLMATGRFTEAAGELGSILKDYPQAGGPYWRDYGYALCRAGRIQEADQVFSRMIARGELPGFASFMRYHIAFERHDLPAAGRFLKRALQLEPTNAEYCVALKDLEQAVPAR